MSSAADSCADTALVVCVWQTQISPSLRSEVMTMLYSGSISSTDLFEGAPEPVLKALCLKVELVEYYTDDFIVRAGDPGTHLYIVHSGKVQIVPKVHVFANALSVSEQF